MEKTLITSAKMLEDYVCENGFLPFFKNRIKGFSLEEMCPPELWFTDKPGPWEWKGPVIRGGKCAYGKFFKNKAVYISLECLPHFCNYRRNGYDFDSRCDEGLVYYRDRQIYGIIENYGTVNSKVLRAEAAVTKEEGGIDKYITRLQMQTYVVTADFEYEKDRHGNPYGWGVARYCTPEYLYGKDFIRSEYKTDPESSFSFLLSRICGIVSEEERENVIKLLK